MSLLAGTEALHAAHNQVDLPEIQIRGCKVHRFPIPCEVRAELSRSHIPPSPLQPVPEKSNRENLAASEQSWVNYL